MKRLSPLLVAGVIVLALAGLALAATTKRLQGAIAGSEGGTVTLTAALTPGNPHGKKVLVAHSFTGATAKNVPYRCEDGSTGSLTYKFGRIAVGDDLSFSADAQATPTMTVEISGKLADQFGRKVTGQVRAEGTKTLPEGSKIACGTFELGSRAGSFTAK